MRACFVSLCGLIVLVPSIAMASVTEPNGKVVPGPSSTAGETSLSSFFTSRGEAIDALADASTTPDTFAPLCGFTAEFVLNQAGEHHGIAWYNVIPGATSAPTGTDLHEIVAAGAPVGTKVTGADIAKDPAYKGGLIGFALTYDFGQTHYSEKKWNVVCTACTPAAPWILSLTYQSKTTENAYYLGFEDGTVTSSDFGNDGDFNDDVFLLTGLQCPGAGKACDTGKKGICAIGATSCEGGKVVCKDAIAPGAKKCNGLDNDCDGNLDDGPCPTNTICTRGACIPQCGSGEFKCPGKLVCDKGVCVEESCVGKTCDADKTCVGGMCVNACDGVKCPQGQMCTGGVCIDTCSFLTCGSGEVCDQGLCKPDCSCVPCGSGTSCDTTTKKCVPPACVGKTCAAGTVCDAATGGCVDACIGVTCPKGQVCTTGKCVADTTGGDAGPDASDDSGAGPVLDGSLGDDDASTGLDASPEAGTAFQDDTGKESRGCGCSTPGGAPTSAGALALLLALFARRRRR